MLEKLPSFFIMRSHHTTRFDEELVMGRLVVPDEQAHSHALLRLELEQFSEREVAALRERPGRRRLAHQLHLVVHRPADDVNHMVRLQYRVADVLPALVVLELLPPLELDVRQVPLVDVRVLVERDFSAVAEREVGVLDALLVRVAGDAAPVHRVGGERPEPVADAERGAGLVGLAAGSDDGDPLLDLLGRGDDPVGGDGGGADELRAEGVVVLDLELEHGGAVRERHGELLVPVRLLAVGDDGGARDDGAGDGERDVGVAGDDPAVVVAAAAGLPDAAAGGRGLPGRAGGGGAAGGEAAADVLGEHVHVGQQPRLDNPQVEVPVQEDRLGRRRRLVPARRRHRRRRGPGSGGGQLKIGAGPPVPGGPSVMPNFATATAPATRRGFRWGRQARPPTRRRMRTAKLEEEVVGGEVVEDLGVGNLA